MQHETLKYILVLLGSACGLFLIVRPWVGMTRPLKWVAVASLIAGILTMVWGSLVVLTTQHLIILNKVVLILCDDFKTLITGLVIGIILTLFIGGQLKKAAWERKGVSVSDKSLPT